MNIDKECQLPIGNNGERCGQTFPPRVVLMASGMADKSTGDYVQHLIREHWELLVKVREAMENGEI